MQLHIKRFEFGTNYTIGKLYIDGVYECFTLEPTVRTGPKVIGHTAIPVGSYQVVVDMSTRFARLMPHILDVDNFQGVRIHYGNSAINTEGCVLVGTTWAGGDFIGNSQIAFKNFFAQLSAVPSATLLLE